MRPHLLIQITSVKDGSIRVSFDDIMYLDGDRAYTQFHLKNGSVVLAPYNIKCYERIFPHFIRIHKSYLVNTRYIKHFSKTGGVGTYNGYVTLKNGKTLDVARRRIGQIATSPLYRSSSPFQFASLQ
ncbi:LytR/AlgR family response regulator transcription factor [Larkinella ripae]